MDLPLASFRVVVAIATYKRPEGLAALLISLQKQESDHIFRIVVVDNDGSSSARNVTTNVAPEADYVLEPRRGISAARNAGIRKAMEYDPDAVAFVDDDETAATTWIGELVRKMVQHDADVVSGPVEYNLTSAPADHKYFQKLQRPDGSTVKYVATNNTLVRASWFEGSDPLWFNEAYGLTGGEDLELFLRLQKRGGRCIWAERAVVSTQVPEERTRKDWITQREFRNGQMIARLNQQFDGLSRPTMVLVGIGKFVSGLILASRARLGRRVNIAAEYKVFAGAGWVSAALGWYYREYRHPTPAAVPLPRQTEHTSGD
ncbi:glycosyltransferase [Paenarthrobacter sp. NPDC089989]|uniref:glycosyltransferase n=1 Tax=unclassified Paenarthrobacter TaxID=2634190 RepID=UPI0037FFDCDB